MQRSSYFQIISIAEQRLSTGAIAGRTGCWCRLSQSMETWSVTYWQKGNANGAEKRTLHLLITYPACLRIKSTREMLWGVASRSYPPWTWLKLSVHHTRIAKNKEEAGTIDFESTCRRLGIFSARIKSNLQHLVLSFSNMNFKKMHKIQWHMFTSYPKHRHFWIESQTALIFF